MSNTSIILAGNDDDIVEGVIISNVPPPPAIDCVGYVNSDKETRQMGIAGYLCKFAPMPDGMMRVYIDRQKGRHLLEGPYFLEPNQIRKETK